MNEPAKKRIAFRAPIAVGNERRLPCSTCGQSVDPLRASRVAAFSERFCYFCSPECREGFDPGASAASPEPPAREREARAPSVTPGLAEGELPDANDFEPPSAPRPRPEHQGWLTAGLWLGLLSALGTTPIAARAPLWLAPALATAACAAVLRGLACRKASGDGMHRYLGALLAPLAATLSALGSLLLHPASIRQTTSVAGVVCAVAAGSLILLARRRGAFEAERATLERALEPPAPSAPDARERASDDDPRPGQELVLQAGDRISVDAVVSAGRATVSPWLGSRRRVVRQEGDALLAGAQVLEGALRAVVRWTDNDRAWARLTRDPQRRADRHMAVARLAERIASTGAGALGLSVGVAALWLDRHPLLALAYAAAAGAGLANVALIEIVSLYISRGVYRLLAHGISFRSAAALDRAAATSTVVFCDPGTLLCGNFSVASIEPAGHLGADELLSLLAGAYAGLPSPVGAALQRSAQAQKLRPDTPRSPNYLPGLGVTAVASNGQALVAGTRTLLLERRISVASAEAAIAELEALGRSVLLVALDGRWVGLVALQDSLHPGARAAVHRLLDADVEPVLLSSEARETCRALARQIGIEHVRPEVLPEDRAQEVRRLAQNGATLAVIGRSTSDDAALAAARLSINVDVAGGPLERWDVDVASGDVRDAAAAIQLARELNEQARQALLGICAPLAGALLLLMLGAPPWLPPVSGLLGATLALKRIGAPQTRLARLASGGPAASAAPGART